MLGLLISLVQKSAEGRWPDTPKNYLTFLPARIWCRCRQTVTEQPACYLRLRVRLEVPGNL